MRIKNDFVTNSSSTNFLFAFSGDTRKDLYKSIIDHDSCFFLCMEYDGFIECIPKEEGRTISCRAEDVIEALKSVRRKTKIITIDEKIKEFEEEVERIKGYDINYPNRYACFIYECKSRIAILNYAKELGITSVLEVNFGDNDGPFSGTKIGMIMDYEGRYINILSDSLVVLTDQRR